MMKPRTIYKAPTHLLNNSLLCEYSIPYVDAFLAAKDNRFEVNTAAERGL
jgi:hypothetical protein